MTNELDQFQKIEVQNVTSETEQFRWGQYPECTHGNKRLKETGKTLGNEIQEMKPNCWIDHPHTQFDGIIWGRTGS